MKSNLVKMAIALASVAFVLACQDLGSGVVGPDGLVPQLAKGGEKGKPGGGGGLGDEATEHLQVDRAQAEILQIERDVRPIEHPHHDRLAVHRRQRRNQGQGHSP